MRKLRLSTKFPSKEIRWNNGILRSACEAACFICNKPYTTLCAAGVIHVRKIALEKQHVKETTEKVKKNGNYFGQQAHSC